MPLLDDQIAIGDITPESPIPGGAKLLGVDSGGVPFLFNVADVSVDLSAYATTAAMNTAIAAEALTINNRINPIETSVNAIIAGLVPPPNYQAPGANIGYTPDPNNRQLGEVITSLQITAAFDQRNGGASTGLSITKNGVSVSTTTPYTEPNVVMTLTPKNYQVIYTYGQGAIITNIIGAPDARGRIGAGSAMSGVVAYRGYYFLPFGSADAAPSDNTTARALPQNRLSNASNVFNLTAHKENLKQYVILEPGKTITNAIDLTSSGAPVTFALINNNFGMIDLSGNAITGLQLFERAQGAAYDKDHTFQITTN